LGGEASTKVKSKINPKKIMIQDLLSSKRQKILFDALKLASPQGKYRKKGKQRKVIIPAFT